MGEDGWLSLMERRVCARVCEQLIASRAAAQIHVSLMEALIIYL